MARYLAGKAVLVILPWKDRTITRRFANMINEETGFHEDSTQEISPATSQAAGEIQNLIGPAIQQTVSQYHGLLRQGLEREVQRNTGVRQQFSRIASLHR